MLRARRAEALAAAFIAALTLWRLGWLPASVLGLYVDEAQYWLWGQEMAAGAYSKPPLVGWIIRAATELLGDGPAAVRAPWPLVHAGAALAVMALGRRLAGPVAGALAGASYATLPAVSLGALLVSTDSPMLLALALTLWLWHRTAAGEGSALALGAAIGAGLWAKYAMLFALAGLALAALRDPGWRLRPRDAIVAALLAAVLIAPNLAWNRAHDFATFRHTAEIAEAAAGLDWRGLMDFLAAQLAVAGPLVLAGMILCRPAGGLRGPKLVAAVILAIVSAQALRGGANANWAVGAYVPGSVVAGAWLATRPRLAAASLGLGTVLALALPVFATRPDWLPEAPRRTVAARYLDAPRDVAAALAAAPGARLIVATDRELAALATYASRIPVRALPARDRPPASHYELLYPLTTEAGPAFLLARTGTVPGCAGPQTAHGSVVLAPLSPACLEALRHQPLP